MPDAAAPSYEELSAENERLRAMVAELEEALAERGTGLQAELDALRDEIARLEAELGRNSENSSKPPAQDPCGTT